MFRPREEERWELSCDREMKHSAEQAHAYRVDVAKLSCKGVWALSVDESNNAGHRVVDDSARNQQAGLEASPAHAHIDMRNYGSLGKNPRRAMRQKLLLFALRRRRQYPPSEALEQMVPLFDD